MPNIRTIRFAAIAAAVFVSVGVNAGDMPPNACNPSSNAESLHRSADLPICAGLASGDGCAVRNGFDITREMGTGWNLGNTMDSIDEKPDAPGDETRWGNPRTTRVNVDKLKDLGMNTLRIPVSWDNHVSGPDWTIDNAWMDRVEEIVNYALDNGMYAIVNVHHNNGWEEPTSANEARANDILAKLWVQIAQRFKPYGHHLIFEVMNEPHVTVNGKEDWKGKPEYFEVVNRLNLAALAAIRASGGNNARRLVMLPSYAATGGAAQLDAVVMPPDRMVALSTHAYMPSQFTMKWAGTAEFHGEKEIDQYFDRLTRNFIEKGVPVVIGEWGSIHKNNLAQRVRHAAYLIRSARRAGIPTIVWDNGDLSVSSEQAEVFGLLDRRNNTWVYPELMHAIMGAVP